MVKATKKEETPNSEVSAVLADVQDLTKDSAYLPSGYLPQSEDAFTSLAVIEIKNPPHPLDRFIVRQTDIINNQIVLTSDSKPMERMQAYEKMKMATYQFVRIL